MTFVAVASLAVMDVLEVVYLMTSILSGDAFLHLVVRLHYKRDGTATFRAFCASNTYLRMSLLAIVADTLVI